MSDEPDEKIRKMAEIAQNNCYAGYAFTHEIPLESMVYLNGDQIGFVITLNIDIVHI